MNQEKPVSKQDGVIQPSQKDVAAAVERSGDQQLAVLMADPGGYVLRPTDFAGVKHHRIYRVLFTGSDHPMSFWLAADRNGAHATVLSQHLAGVATFLRDEPDLLGSADIAARFHELYRDQGVHSEVLRSPAPLVERRADGLHLRLAVRNDDQNEIWKVDLPTAGAPAISVEVLP